MNPIERQTLRWPIGRSRLPHILLAGVLASCGDSNSSNPRVEDLMSGLKRQNEDPIIEASLGQCRVGVVEGNGTSSDSVRLCGFCVITAHVRVVGDPFAGGGTRLVAERRLGTAMFRKAVSADYPNVRPVPGEQGVWVLDGAGIRLNERFRWQALPLALATELGYEQQTGFNATLASGLPAHVVENFASDDSLRRRAATAIGDCESSLAGENTQPPRASSTTEDAYAKTRAAATADTEAAAFEAAADRVANQTRDRRVADARLDPGGEPISPEVAADLARRSRERQAAEAGLDPGGEPISPEVLAATRGRASDRE